VVHHPKQHVLLRPEPVERAREERPAREVEGTRRALLEQLDQVGLPARRGHVRQIDRRQQLNRRVGAHDLHGLPVVFTEDGPHHLVPRQDLLDRSLEGLCVQRPTDAERRGQVLHREPWVELLQEPEALLHERQGRGRALLQPRDGHRVARRRRRLGLGQQRREPRHRGRLEQLPEGEHDAVFSLQPRQHLRREHRVSAQVEEVVVHRDGLHAQ
jgi:hypothetical protein